MHQFCRFCCAKWTSYTFIHHHLYDLSAPSEINLCAFSTSLCMHNKVYRFQNKILHCHNWRRTSPRTYRGQKYSSLSWSSDPATSITIEAIVWGTEYLFFSNRLGNSNGGGGGDDFESDVRKSKNHYPSITFRTNFTISEHEAKKSNNLFENKYTNFQAYWRKINFLSPIQWLQQ